MGTILTLTGPSGTGKTTLARELVRVHPHARMIPSITTRAKRDSDLPGEYIYADRRSIEQLEEEERLLWKVTHGEHLYATDYREVASVLSEPDAVGIMILVPGVMDKLHKFLQGMGREGNRVSVFLLPLPDALLWSRLEAGGRDVQTVLDRKQTEEGWTTLAQTSHLNYYYLLNDGTIEETVEHVRDLLP